jgi:hypothetical protein
MRAFASTVAIAVAGIGGLSRDARADGTGRACAATFEQAQSFEHALQLRAGRASALGCVAAPCPGVVREACAAILASIDAAQPTVVLSAETAAGQDLVDVTVELDGAPFAARLGAGALAIDPGEHTLRFTLGGQPPIEQHVLMRIAEKNRSVKVRFPPATSVLPVVGVSTSAGASPLLPIVLAGAGLASIGASIGIGVIAKSDAEALRTSCAPGCSPAAVSDVSTRLVVSDVLLGTGVAIVAVAGIVFFVRRGGHASAPSSAHVVPTARGFALTF